MLNYYFIFPSLPLNFVKICEQEFRDFMQEMLSMVNNVKDEVLFFKYYPESNVFISIPQGYMRNHRNIFFLTIKIGGQF